MWSWGAPREGYGSRPKVSDCKLNACRAEPHNSSAFSDYVVRYMGSNTISTPDLAPEAGEALVAIRRLVQVLRAGAAATERSAGLSSAQLFVLQILRTSEAHSINDLARWTMTDQSSVSAVVARLQGRGFVQRTAAKEDARRTIVSITPEGERILDGAPVTLQARLISALRQMSEASLRTLTQELSHLAALLGAKDEPLTFLFENDATGAR